MKNKYFLLFLFSCINFNIYSQSNIVEVNVNTPLPACLPGDCTDLLAVYSPLKQTTSYTPTAQTYNPVYLTEWDGIFGHKINASADDIWSPVFNLPFNFTFYGVTYNKVIIGSNGVISFDITNAGGVCPWAYSATIPSTTFPVRNAIYGVYQDTDIRDVASGGAVTLPNTQNVNFYIKDTGINVAPNRVFVANWNELPQYNCGTGVGLQTSQIVLHEGTNQIEINIKKRSCCSGWNTGSGVIGTQNAAGTIATFPPTRNTGCWSTVNESWSLNPAGPVILPTLNWELGGVPTGAPDQNPLNVCPTGPAIYTAIVEYTNPNGTKFTVEKDITVDLEGPLPVRSPLPVTICDLGVLPYNVNINQDLYILNGAASSSYNISYHETEQNAKDGIGSIITPNNYLLTTAPPKTIWVRIEDTSSLCYNVRPFNIIGSAFPSGTFSYASSPYCNTLAGIEPITPVGLSSGGTFSTIPPTTDLILNPTTGDITPLGSLPGTYTVNYNVPAVGVCPAYDTTASVTINPCNCTVTVNSSTICSTDTATVTATPTNAASYQYVWTVPALASPPGNVSTFTTNIAGTYSVIITDSSTLCSSGASGTVIVVPESKAGLDVTIDACENNPAIITLFNQLVGSPQAGGTWTRTGTGTGGTFVGGLVGTFIPAVGATTSTFEYTVAGTFPCPADISVVTINIIQQPVAGIDGALLVCDNDITNIVNLFSLLGGTPQTGGTWTRTGTGTGGTFVGGTTGTFTPAVGATTSTFLYSLPGTLPCVNDDSTVTITIISKADAGASNAITICDNDPAVINLFSLLGGTPQMGGNWTRTGTGVGGSFNTTLGLFTPSIGATPTTSTFEYTIVGTPPCSNAVSTVTVNINKMPNAGTDGGQPVCDNDTNIINLFSLLGGTPQTGGNWTRTGTGTGGTFAGGTTGTFTPAVGATTSTFLYTLPGTLPCINDDSTVTITIIPEANAGIDAIKNVCENDTTQLNLFSLLTGSPQVGGIWTRTGTGTGGTFVGGTIGKFTPAVGATTSTFEYTVAGISPCPNDVNIVTVNILPLPGATISVDTPIVCLNTLPKPKVTFTGSGGTPPYSFSYTIDSGFPQFIQTTATSNSVSIDVDTNTTGTFRYDLIIVGSSTTPVCNNPQTDFVNVTILPLPFASISLTGAVQACLNTTSPQITITGSSGNAPYTFDYKLNGILNSTTVPGNSLTLTVPNIAGNYTYELVGVSSATSPSCSQVLTGINRIITVTIVPLPSINLSLGSLPIQTVCNNSPISDIVYTIGGSATSASLLGTLPNGVTGVFSSPNIFTISGTPTVSSSTPYNFTINTVGGCLPLASLNGSITVNPSATITLIPSNTNQSVCIDTQAITAIKYVIGNGATNINLVGALPAGVTGNLNLATNIYTISGTPSSAGIYNYDISATGGCPSNVLSGTIEVKPKVTMILTSVPTTTYQVDVCLGENITNITYLIENGAIGATASGLPTGVLQNYNPITHVFTISGPANSLGNFNYTVTTNGGCDLVQLTGTIIVIPSATIALNSPILTASQTVCIDKPILDIEYLLDNGATGASVSVNQLPDGVSGNVTGTTYTLSGTPTESGMFNYTITTIGGCSSASISGIINVKPLPVVELDYEDYICVDVNGIPTTSSLIKTNLSSSIYTFIWSDSNGVIVPAETGSSYSATAPGTYSVEVTNTATTCVGTASATIVSSLPPSVVNAIASNYFSDDQTITINVIPIGIYEYQLDNGAFQDSNQFIDLTSGWHNIFVRDKYKCGTATTKVRIINFPKFFTPNGDGYNDLWNIYELSDQPFSKIYVFDRYGKLMKEIVPTGLGWDGTFNGTSLPASDYWFKVFFDEAGISKTFKSHFSLKR